MMLNCYICVTSLIILSVLYVVTRKKLQPSLHKTLTLRRSNANDIVTVFFQGNGVTRAQASHYTGDDGVRYFTSHNIMIESVNNHSPTLLYNIFPCKELEDIYTTTCFNSILLPLYYLVNPLFFVHLIINLFFSTKTSGKGSHCHVLSFLKYFKLNVGGWLDMKQHRNMVIQCTKQNPDKKLVLFGSSRGAATTFTSFAFLEPELQRKVKLVIVEGTYDTVPNVVRHRFTRFGGPVMEFLLESLAEYKKGQVSPLEAAHNFPLDTPVAFVYSETDSIVPASLTKNVIRVLNERGHKKLHILSFKDASHSGMSLENVDNQIAYKNFVEDLYDKYCL